MGNGTKNPKKEVHRFFADNRIRHYRDVELRKSIVEFVKTCRAEQERIKREPRRREAAILHLEEIKKDILDEYWGTNGNGERIKTEGFLDQMIRW